MRRWILRAFGLLALLVILAAAAAVVGFLFVQDLRIRPQSDGTAVVDVQFLGEYFANATRIRITEVATGTTVFEASASREFFQVWTFGLRLGENPTHLGLGLKIIETRTAVDASSPRGGLGGLFIDIPKTGNTFELRGETPYQLTIWTIKEGLHVHRSARFMLHEHHGSERSLNCPTPVTTLPNN
jgi:hypothetical protein